MSMIDVDAQAAEAVGREVLDGRRARVDADEDAPSRARITAELHRQDGLVAPAGERPPHQHLVVAHGVEVAGVDQRDARSQRGLDGGDALDVVGGAVDAGHGHATEAQREYASGPVAPSFVEILVVMSSLLDSVEVDHTGRLLKCWRALRPASPSAWRRARRAHHHRLRRGARPGARRGAGGGGAARRGRGHAGAIVEVPPPARLLLPGRTLRLLPAAHRRAAQPARLPGARPGRPAVRAAERLPQRRRRRAGGG